MSQSNQTPETLSVFDMIHQTSSGTDSQPSTMLVNAVLTRYYSYVWSFPTI